MAPRRSSQEETPTEETGPFDDTDSTTVNPSPHPTNFSGDTGPIAGVVVHELASESDDEATGSVKTTSVVTEAGEVSDLKIPLNIRDFIDPTADNRSGISTPRVPQHVYVDDSPDKPEDYKEPELLESVEDQSTVTRSQEELEQEHREPSSIL